MILVYIVNRIDGPGGLERVLSIKATMLADEFDYKIHIITLNQDNENLFYDFSSKITYHNIEAIGNPISKMFAYISGLNEIIKKISPHVIAVCDDGLKGFFVPIIVKKPCPMIYERHVSKNVVIRKDAPSIFNKINTKIKFSLMNFGGRFYDRFVVLTNGNLKEWNFKNIVVIPNPLSFCPEKQSKLVNKNVLAVGKQSYQKGYDRLLKSWKIVTDTYPEWTLNIYGTINESEGLVEQAGALKIGSKVNFYQPVKNIAEKYQEASIYVMSSRYEGFGMVLTEAMAYGVPCVSFDCPFGPSDIITNKENGILIKNGDTEGLANAIKLLIDNDEMRKSMGKNARISVNRYMPKKIGSEWNDLFTSLISN